MTPEAGFRLALLPAVLVAILTLWSGTFSGVATAVGAMVTQAAILGFCALTTQGEHDPLRLGRAGRWLVLALVVLGVVSWWFSPVSRAGTVGLLLLPAVLLVPASTARCWTSTRARELGLAAVSALTALVSILALIQWQALSLPRASLPLGHHNLLAAWLILVLPLALTGIDRPGPRRWLALIAGTSALAALGATGSLLAGVAVAIQLTVASLWWPRLRRWSLPLASIAVLSTLPRLLSIAQVEDLSAVARGSYLAAGWRGFLARPAIGWGPGAVPWTLGAFMEPVPGVHPPSQVIGDLHSLPAQILYELGLAGLLLLFAILGVFGWRRWIDARQCSEPTSRRASLLGLLGGGVFFLGAAPLSVPALPVTAAVVAGVSFDGGLPGARRWPPLLWAYLVAAAVILVPLDRAHLVYDKARRSQSAQEGHTRLEQAHALDPEFPLYLARAAWQAAEIQGIDGATAERARRAAEMAPGLAPLWLEAGSLGKQSGAEWAAQALATAYRLDPLSPLTAFHLMTVSTDFPTATSLGHEAVRGEPRLASALWWLDNPDLARSVCRVSGVQIPTPGTIAGPQAPALALGFDRQPSLSFSLFAFRRSPWPGRLAAVVLGTDSG